MVKVCESSIGPTWWNKASADEKKRFLGAYTTLLINTYGSALANYKDEQIVFYKVRGSYDDVPSVKVNSKILRTDAPAIPVQYLLSWDEDASDWKVIDMSVEGISLLESFRTQFAQELKAGGMKQLLKTLDTHNAKVNAEQSAKT
jgi:phospholipid transport system substrate-binding protein